jgi:YidC/Oxa1 family membrane protein insertase
MFTTIVIQPLFNAIIYTVNFLPGHQLWIAMVVVTLIFKIILIPLFKKQVRDQIVLQYLAPKLKALQEKYKDKRDVLAKETLALYAKYKVNVLMSILILFIQLPFLIGLYQIFYYDLTSYQNLLYAGVNFPEIINKSFFGFDLGQKSIILAVLAAISQYILGAYMFKKKTKEEEAQETEMIKAMNMQMKYFLPVMIGFISYITPSVISLYLIVTNIFGIVQEVIIKKPLEEKIKKELAEEDK